MSYLLAICQPAGRTMSSSMIGLSSAAKSITFNPSSLRCISSSRFDPMEYRGASQSYITLTSPLVRRPLIDRLAWYGRRDSNRSISVTNRTYAQHLPGQEIKPTINIPPLPDAPQTPFHPLSSSPPVQNSPSSPPPLQSPPNFSPFKSTHENIYNIPNFLTLTRILSTPIICYLIINSRLSPALFLFSISALTDLFDGWYARRYNLQTVVGSVLDPMADKLLMTTMTISLTYSAVMPLYLAVLILGRDVALSLAALYYRYASLPGRKTWRRYWDFSLPSAIVHPTNVSKVNTALQVLLIAGMLGVAAWEEYFDKNYNGNQLKEEEEKIEQRKDVGQEMKKGLEWAGYGVAATTIWSGLSYAVLKDAVTILGNEEALKAKQGRMGRGIIGVLFGGVVFIAGWYFVNDTSRKRGKESEELSNKI